MKTLEEIKEEYARSLSCEYENLNWQSLLAGNGTRNMEHHHDSVAKIYSKEVSREALKNASENACLIESIRNSAVYDTIDKSSILNEDNIPEL